MSLEERLAATAEQWLAEETLSEAQAGGLAGLVKNRARRRQSRWLVAVAAALAALVIMPVVSPGARAWAEETFPWLARYMGRQAQVEPGWAWAEAHGMFQEVLAVAHDQGYTFRVHSVLADPTQTTIIYTVEGPDPGPANFWAGERDTIRFNGRDFVGGGGGAGEIMDGVFVGNVEVDPLPAERGTLTIALQQIGDVKGSWRVSFPVSRAPLSELTRTIKVNQTLPVAGGTLEVTEVQVLPTQTVVHLRYEGPAPAPDFLGTEAAQLHTNAGRVQSRGMSARGSGDPAGQTVNEYRLAFQPLPTGATTVALRIRSLYTVDRTARLSLPLESGATAAVDGLPAVRVEVEAPGRATISLTVDGKAPNPYGGWHVIDDQGTAYPAQASGSSSGSTYTRTIQYDKLPPGRRAVALEAREVWRQVAGNWEVAIPLN